MAARKPPTTAETNTEPEAATVVVEPGDTWAVLADREGVDVAALVSANGGQAGQPLIVGEALVRP